MSQIRGHHNRSSSQKSFSQYLSDTSELTDEELVKQVNELKEQVKTLTLENEIFEKTIMRLDPALMNGVQQALELAVKYQKFNQSNSSVISLTAVKSRSELTSSHTRLISVASPSRVSAKRSSVLNLRGTIIYGCGPRINILERSELVEQELQIMKENHEKIKKKAAKKHAILQAKLEVIGVTVTDVDKAVADFQQQVIVEGWDKIAQRIPAEVWIRFMTQWVKTTDLQIGKLRLRTSTLNTQYSKLRGQMTVKAELREKLRPVDFDQLEIENIECQKKIEYEIRQLEELKQMTGKANLYLCMYKKAMVAQNNHLSKVLNEVQHCKNQAVRKNKETDVIKVQVDALAQKLNKIKKLRQVNEVRDIMGYVGVKSELTDLKHSMKILENRLRIVQIAVSSVAKKLQSLHIMKKKEV